MASSSRPNLLFCSHCYSMTDELHYGWRLVSGGYSMLCRKCWVAYEDGTFCAIFHGERYDWQLCDQCLKPIHSFCIMSVNHTVPTEDGVACTHCYESLLVEERQRLLFNASITKLLEKASADSSPAPLATAEAEAPVIIDLTADSPVENAPPPPPSPPKGSRSRLYGSPGTRKAVLEPDAAGWVPLHPLYNHAGGSSSGAAPPAHDEYPLNHYGPHFRDEIH